MCIAFVQIYVWCSQAEIRQCIKSHPNANSDQSSTRPPPGLHQEISENWRPRPCPSRPRTRTSYKNLKNCRPRTPSSPSRFPSWTFSSSGVPWKLKICRPRTSSSPSWDHIFMIHRPNLSMKYTVRFGHHPPPSIVQIHPRGRRSTCPAIYRVGAWLQPWSNFS